MGDMLSQEEIDALLSNTDFASPSTESDDDAVLSDNEMDALGEIGNISMGTSATALFTLLNQKVLITTPQVKVMTWKEITQLYSEEKYVGVRVNYTEGLQGYNLLVIKEKDVKIITDLMMGGEGGTTESELSDLHLSAISEAMNQMVGSSATSMSSMFDKRIDISPPEAFVLDLDEDNPDKSVKDEDKFVKVSFKMEIGDLIDSEIMQILPIKFAKNLVSNLLDTNEKDSDDEKDETIQDDSNLESDDYGVKSKQTKSSEVIEEYDEEDDEYEEVVEKKKKKRPNVKVQPAQFQDFDDGKIVLEKKNINMIMDVPLQITVELGRTRKMIKDVLEFGSGTIIELDKLAGEPVDILVNGKIIAKGEVVVIDESFGVRITDIIKPSKRL
ncbi:MAG: flagellar motor switch phosphatase FliY [Clostridiales bacterium]